MTTTAHTDSKPRRSRRLLPCVLIALVLCAGLLICAMLLPSLPALIAKAPGVSRTCDVHNLPSWGFSVILDLAPARISVVRAWSVCCPQFDHSPHTLRHRHPTSILAER
jgi:hypothetical protein